MKKKHRYLIVYHLKEDKGAGVGNCVVETHKKIKSFEDIESVQEQLKTINNAESIIITNLNYLGKFEWLDKN